MEKSTIITTSSHVVDVFLIIEINNFLPDIVNAKLTVTSLILKFWSFLQVHFVLLTPKISLETQTLCLSKWSDEHRPENTELMMVLLFFSPVKQTHEV